MSQPRYESATKGTVVRSPGRYRYATIPNMPALHIRNLDDAVIAVLKARAARNHRSLQGEVRKLLEEAAAGRPAGRRGRRRLQLRGVSVGRVRSYSRDVIYGDDDR